jgi:hypothetical protein
MNVKQKLYLSFVYVFLNKRIGALHQIINKLSIGQKP